MVHRGFRFILPMVGFLEACAPTLKQPGPSITTAQITENKIITNDGYSLPLRSWHPSSSSPKAILIALHGFNDYNNFFHAPGSYLAKHGILTYAYDQRGFGKTSTRGYWSGSKAYLNDLKTAIKLIRIRHNRIPLFVLGESMGGAVALTAMSQDLKPPVDGIILAAPAILGRETMPFYQRWLLSIATYTAPWIKLTGRGLKIKPSDNSEMLLALSRDPFVIKETRVDTIAGLVTLMDMALAYSSKFERRALVLYGMRDEIILKNPIFLMVQRFPKNASKRQRIALYNNGFHMLLRDREAEILWKDIATWIKNSKAPLPSGSDIGSRRRIAANFFD